MPFSTDVILSILLVYFAIFGLVIADYVMRSLALQTIAARRNIENPWLAWIPVANSWIIGSIADDYDAHNGIKRRWRVVLLTLSIVYIVVYITMYIFMAIYMISMTARFESATSEVGEVLLTILPIYIFLIIICLVVALYYALSCICNFKVFESTVPDKAVLYTILSMLIPMAGSICLLLSKDKFSPYTKISYFPVEATEEINRFGEDVSDGQTF